MKLDPTISTLASDNFLEQCKNPKHRAIIENYRLHAMLEISGRWSEIFVPELTVERPFYRAATPDGLLELDGEEAVQSFYMSLTHAESTVMILEQEVLVVNDEGFGSEALYNFFIPGTTAQARGFTDADPAKNYIEQRWVCMVWPYDERGRMKGERVYPAHTSTLRECPDEEFLTLEDVQKAFAPHIEQAQAALRAKSPSAQPA